VNDRWILHADMDAFFASVEQLDYPQLRGRPVVVGSAPDRRGVIAAASYEARQYGIHSAMPSRTAYRLCPQAVFMPVRGERYREVSHQIMGVFHAFTPLVEPLSVDEAFLDVTGRVARGLEPVALARQLKERVRAETGLTVSVGVAPNKFLAKLASDMDKPDGLTVEPREDEAIKLFVAPLPDGRIWGVGKVTGERLNRFGMHTISDIQQAPLSTLGSIIGPGAATHLKRLADGLDDRPVVTDHEEKSISNETTFDEDVADQDVLRQTLINLTEKVSCRLRRTGRKAATVVVKIRFSDFKTITRQMPLRPHTDSERVLLRTVRELYERENVRRPVRLIGVGVSNLTEPGGAAPSHQPMLFDDWDDTVAEDIQRDASLDAAVDRLREQYGPGIFKRGSWSAKR